MKALLKRTLAATPLARRVYRRLRPASAAEHAKAAIKRRVRDHLIGVHGWRVAYGPFRGMELGREVWWGGYDLTSKILGVYEEDVLRALAAFYADSKAPFVDIGAADGYYAVGVAASGLAERVFAFEISGRGRALLERNAIANRCADRVAIAGAADLARLSAIVGADPEVFVMIDIEGGEYDLLSRELLALLRGATILVELHPRKLADGWARQARLLADAAQWFTVELLGRDAYRPNQFAELSEFSDDERLLAFSEGRAAVGQWALLRPRAASAR